MSGLNLLGLRTVCYYVSDIEKAKIWYSDILGQKPYFDEPFYVGFNVAGYELGLQPEEKTPDKKSENVFAYWGIENMDEAYQKILSLGAKEFHPPMDVGSGIITAELKDPWDNVFGLIYNPHFILEKK
ncbi:MAG: VOC family protein [Candidatus Sericytochromatia bacterium]